MAKIVEVRIPDMGDFDTVDVIEILVSAGTRVSQEQGLITLESDKASMEVPSPMAGTVVELRVKVGDQVGQDALILTLEPTTEESSAEDSAEAAPADKPAATEAAAEPTVETAPTPTPAPAPASTPPKAAATTTVNEAAFRTAYASPSVRHFARQLGADLGRIKGSGRKGRILKQDVQDFVKAALAGASSGPGAGGGISDFAWPSMPEVDFAKFGPIETRPLSRIRQLAAKSLHRSWLHVPHVTQHDEADVTEMEAFRQANKGEAAAKGIKLTPLVFLLKAAAATLRALPEFNASLDPSGENLILKGYVHIGVAVDTPGGLVVPVVRDVDQKGLYALAEDLADLSSRARDSKLLPKDFQGAGFTISSLGGIGGTAFTPIVNAPEVAILGVSRHKWQPVYQGGELVSRLMLPLSLSYDHRVIDGAAAARFVVHLGRLLGDLRRLLL